MPIQATHHITGNSIEFTGYIEARKQGFYHRYIKACLEGRRETYRGYHWTQSSNNTKNFDLLLKPKQLAKLKQIPLKTAQYKLRNTRSVIGVTKAELLHAQLKTLILEQGVTIDACAEKFSTTPQYICKLMEWE